MATKKPKKKKKKIKFKNIFMILLIILVLIAVVAYISDMKISNIYVKGNHILTDKEIIEKADLEDYPPFMNTYFEDIENTLRQNDYIKDVTIKRKFPGKVYLEVEEYRPICIYNSYLILSSGKKIENTYNIDYVPYVINNIDSIFDNFVQKFSLINDEVLLKISHIEYTPNDVDKERFLLYMVDKNYVYITLSKIEKLNKYNSITNELDGKKGIIYLDLGDYVEIKG